MSTTPIVDNLRAGDDDAQVQEDGAQKASKAKNCVECRRLKVKCDRKIPCGHCVKRGRASFCPNGSRTGRLVLPETDGLQAKIQELTARIQDLESALAALQAQVSEEPHPLLGGNQISTAPTSKPKKPDDPNSAPVSTYGSLITKEDGSACFLGETGAVEWVIAMEDGSSIQPQFQIEPRVFAPDSMPDADCDTRHSRPANHSQHSQNSSVFDQDVAIEEFRSIYPNLLGIIPDPLLSYTDTANPSTMGLACAFESSPISTATDKSNKYFDRPDSLNIILKGLPSKLDAINMINTYYERIAVIIIPVPRGRLLREFFIPCYDNFENTLSMRRGLALLYAVFALGALPHPNHIGLAHRYISFSRAALMMDDIITSLTTTTIDTLILQIEYVQFRGGKGSESRGWVMLGQVIRLAQTDSSRFCSVVMTLSKNGLHSRDPAAWGLLPEETLHRRRTMWELVHMDTWTSLYFGRPPMISLQHFDVQMPMDDPDIAEPIPNYNRGKYVFSQQCMWPLLDVALASKNRTTYSAVLEVDRTIRDWTFPRQMQLPQMNPRQEQMIVYEIQRTTVFIAKEVGLLYLHRPYLAAAIIEPPFEPLKNRYTRSVLAAYASACAILAHVRDLHSRHPTILQKMLFFANQGFAAVTMLGSMAAAAPDCSLATSALVEVDLSLEVYKQFAEIPMLKHILRILIALRTKAHAAMESYKVGIWIRPKEIEPSVLQGLGGGVPLLHKNTSNQSAPNISSSSPSSSSDRDEVQRNQSSEVGQTASGVVAEEDDLLQRNQTNQSANFEIFLESYLRSFDPLTSNVSHDNDNNSNDPHAVMHVQSSDEFLHGALTGDWAGLSRPSGEGASSAPMVASSGDSGANDVLMEVAREYSMGGTSDALGTPGIRAAFQRQHGMDISASGYSSSASVNSTPLNVENGSSYFTGFTYNSTSLNGQPTPSNPFAPVGFSQTSHPNQPFVTPNQGRNIGTSGSRTRSDGAPASHATTRSDEGQATLRWDNFWRGVGNDG